jgi:dTDP-4-dehydrorhamnose 3,5-epimerase
MAKDTQNMTRDWERVGATIDGVALKRTRNIVTANSITTELFRSDWSETGHGFGHAIHVALNAGAITAWHWHEIQTDGVFVVSGRMLACLYDRREQSKTHGVSMILRLDACDPQLLLIPPGVVHGFKALISPVSFVNLISHPYVYEDPDEWRLPVSTDLIPIDIVNAQ